MTNPLTPLRRLALASLLFAGVVPTASAFQLQTLGGERTELSRHVGGGQWTFVLLWTTDCIPCEEQKPMLEAFHAAHARSDARVVSVALDGPGALAEIEAVNARTAPSYTVLVAFDDVFHEQFEALSGRPFRVTPTYLLYDPAGAFVAANTGPVSREALERVVAGN